MISICDNVLEIASSTLADLIDHQPLSYPSGRRGQLYTFKSPSKIRKMVRAQDPDRVQILLAS